MNPPPARVMFWQYNSAFTLVELMVTIGVLVLMMILITQLFNSATIITTMGNNHMDADSQARAVFDRMALDFAQLVKRPDVDYFLKDPNNLETTSGSTSGNDQFAFYSLVPGYYNSGTTAGVTSPVSLVGYRVNASTQQLERYGCGLFWNGMVATASGSFMPVVFSGSSTSSGSNDTIEIGWPAATNSTVDSNYEPIGPGIFRMECFYMLKGQTVNTNGNPVTLNSQLSDTPWDKRITGHTSVNGLADVAAIGVVIAVINPKSKALVSNIQLASLAAGLSDFPQTDVNGNFTQPTVNGIDLTQPGGLESEWEAVISSGTTGIPRVASSAIRVYKRYFYLPPNTIY